MSSYSTPSPRTKSLSRGALGVAVLLALLISVLARPGLAQAQGGPPFIYYVPIPEDQIKATYDTIQTNGSTYEATSFIIASFNGTVITYDHWEDGYEANIAAPVQASTRVFGDSNTANGDADAYCSASCAGDIVNAGDVLVMAVNQTVTIPRNPGQIKFDGRDKWATNYPVSGGRAYWPTDAGPLMAEAAQFYSTDDYGTSFVMPVGENVSAYSYEAFERVAAFIMAGSNQTNCTYNGSALSPLNEGQSLRRPNVQTGDAVVCDKPVQMHLLTGDTGSKYEVRAFEAFARNTWTNSYYDPVGTTNTKYPSVNYVYNPHTTALTVLAETRFGTTNLTVAPNNVVRFVKPDSAVHLYSSDGRDFYALNVNDAATVQTNNRMNETYDWGHPLIPEGLLTTMMVSGWSPGSDDGSAPNAGPVWVTALANTTLYIDYDADPTTGAFTDSNGNQYDTTLALTRLQSARIYDTADNDQTGLRLYTLDGVKISGAWGEDGSRAKVARPNIDAGTVSLPFPVPSLNKSVGLANDADSDGLYDPGDIALYRIVVRNAGGRVLTGVRVEDTLPAGVTYVADSTTLDGAAVADDAGAFPLLAANGGLALPNPTQPPGTVPAGAQYVIEFRVTINPSAAGKVLTNTAFLFTDQEDLQSSVDITVPPSTITSCTLDFTDGAGASVSFVLENGLLYVTVADADKNLNSSAQETVGVQVRNLDGGDEESLVLTETTATSGIFRNTAGLPVSPDSGAAAQDGVMNARAGQTLQADYADALFGDICNDTLLVAGPSQTKLLYLSEPGQAMDRVDPVATSDSTTSSSTVFNAGAGGGGVVVAATTNTTGAIGTGGGNVTFSHTPGAGSDLLLVAVGVGANGAGEGGNVTGVTFGGAAMTQVGYIRNDDSTAAIKVYLFALANPADAAANVVVTAAADSDGTTIAAGATTFSGVDVSSGLTSALRTGGGVNSAVVAPTGLPNALSPANSGSAAVTSAVDDLVFSIGAWDEDGTNQSISTASGQSELWKYSGFNYVSAAASTKPGASSVTVSYTAGNSQEWGIVAVSIKPLVGGGGGGGGVVSVGATTSGATSSASSLTFSHTPGSGSDRLLLVAVDVGDDSYNSSNPGTVTGVTYGGTALTQVGSVSNGAVRSYIYRLINPAPGPANVVVQISNTSSIVAGATTFTGVDQTTPLGAFASDSASSGTSGSATVSSGSGELVFSTGAWDEGSTNQSISIGFGQSELWTRSGQNYVSSAASTKPGAASVTVSYSAGDSQEWVVGAVPIKPAAGGGGGGDSDTVTFVQTPPMASNFNLPSGGLVAATAYISVTGTLPANPVITATLKAGGSTFATLTNPTATLISSGGSSANAAYKVGSFTKSTATGNQTVTHTLGTTPKAILLWTSGKTNETISAGYLYGFGMSDGTTEYSFAAASQDAVGTSNASRRFAAKAVTIVQWGETLLAEADLSSWDSSSFTLNWTTNNATAYVMHYMIIGGADVQAKVVNWQMRTTTGNSVITGVGFQPNLVFHANAGQGLTGAAPSNAASASINLGAMNAAGAQWCLSTWARDGATTTETSRLQRTDNALCQASGNGSGTSSTESLTSYVSMNSDGFSVNWTDAATGAGQIASLALRGAPNKLGSFNKSTTTGNQAVTGVGFQPEALMLALHGTTASTSVGQPARFGLGAADGTTQGSVYLTDEDAATTSDANGVSKTSKVLTKLAGSSLVAEAGLASQDPDGFTLNWTNNDEAVTAQVLYLALDALQSSSASVYRLDWTGALAADAIVPASQQVVLEVQSAETEPAQVLYDSSTYPSKVSLPTNTVINVDALAFYDAPYPGGSLLTNTSPGQTVYIRARVSDPFGAYDVTGAALDIGGSIVTLNDSHVAASDDTSKTYEYAWFVPLGSCSDTYSVTIVASEGFEDITATAQAEILSICDDFGTPCAAHFLDALGGMIVTTYNAGDTVSMQVVDLDQNLNSGAVDSVTATVDGTPYILTETGASTGVFEGIDSTIGSGQLVSLTYVDPNTVLPGADVCTAVAQAPLSGAGDAGITVLKQLTQPAVGSAVVGDVVRFELLVANTGNVTLNPVVVVDTFDSAKLQFTSANPSPTSTGTGTLTWNNLGPLADGGSATIEVVFLALATAQPTVNSVTATGTPPSGPPETDSANANVTIIGPHVALSKTTLTPANRQAKVNDNVTFRIVVNNDGDSVIDVLPLTDNFDAVCLEFVSANPVSSAAGNGVLYWQDLTQTFSQNLGLGQSFTIDVTFRTLEVCDPAVNGAEVTFARDVNGNSTPPVSDDDYVQTAAVYDFGDAPNSYGTLLAANGAQHTLSLFQALQLGASGPDTENDGLPTPAAAGDDLAGSDDEDGLTAPAFVLTTSTSMPLSVSVLNNTGAPATLACWIDFNRDGDFLDTGERAAVSVPYAASQQTATVTFSGFGTPMPGASYVRCRVASAAAEVANPTGLASNGEVEDHRVTIIGLASIGDYLWYDADADGLQDVGEFGIANVTIQLTGPNGVQSTTTGADGSYLFAGLAPGNYVVEVTDANGVLNQMTHIVLGQSQPSPTAVITLQATETYLDADFGYVVEPGPGEAVIGDFVWYDDDDDGLQDPGEPGISNVEVCATPVGGGADICTTTDSAGRYLILVPAGNYLVAPAPAQPELAGLLASTAQPVAVAVAAGDQYLDADFGYSEGGTLLGSIGNQVWNDTPPIGFADGVYNPPGEPGLANVSVDLIRDENGNSGWDSGEPIISTVYTDLTGQYRFNGLPAGDYLVRVSDTLHILKKFSPTTPGPNQGQDNNNRVQPYAITLAAGQQNLTADFGYVRATVTGGGDPIGVIGNQVWYDANYNGLFEPNLGEVGIPGVTVELSEAGGPVVDVQTTNGAGSYVFRDLAPDDYLVEVTDAFGVLANLLITLAGPNPGQDNNNQAQPYAITLAADEENLTADFGYALPASLGDFIFFDSNGNGTQDPGETTGINGVPVTAVNLSTNQSYPTVSVNGAYLLNNLPPGTYSVSVPSGVPGLIRTTISPIVVTLLAGQNYTQADFGYIAPTAVQLASFMAAREGTGAMVRWSTSFEYGQEGFRVWRSASADGPFQPMSGLIPAQNNPAGASYEWFDAAAANGAYWYKLESAPDGEFFGPVSAEHVQGLQRVFAPLVLRRH